MSIDYVGRRVSSLLKQCFKRREVSGSIPARVCENFQETHSFCPH